MKRLTGRNDFGEITSYNPEIDYVAGDKEIRNRLAAYGDIGLTPNEVVSLKAEITQIRGDYESVKNWNACEKEEYEKLLAENIRLREKTCWIPVYERLPEEYIMILVWDGNVVFRAEYAQKEWHGVPDNTGFLPEQITHWLPLPEGPNVQQKGVGKIKNGG